MLLLDFLLPPPRPRRNANPPEPALPRGAASRRGAAGAAGAGRGAPSPGRSFSLHPRPHGVPTPRLGSPRTRRHPRTSTGDGAARGAVPRGLRGDAPTLPCHRSSAGSPGPPHGGGVAVGGPEPTAETRARLGLCSTIGLWCPWGSPQPPQYADREVISGGQAAGAFCAECSCVACHNQAFLRRGKEKFPKRF